MSRQMTVNYETINVIDSIENIKNILTKLGFEILIETKEANGVYLTRISDIKTGALSRGKGTDKNEAIISGLGEFLERLSFGMLESYPYYLYSLKNKHNRLITFHNFKDTKQYYISAFDLFEEYRSTGMATGNSVIDALNRSIAEIFERYVEYKILTNSMPIIYCKASEYKLGEFSRRIYKALKQNRISEVFLIKCKEDIFPVIGVIVVDYSKGKYVFRFAADLSIDQAIEKCFTELFQLESYENIFDKMGINIMSKSVSDWDNIYELITNGRGLFPLDKLLTEHAIFEVVKNNPKDPCGINIKYFEILKYYGWNIYFREKRYENIVSVHTIIPNISNIYFEQKKKNLNKKNICDLSVNYYKGQIAQCDFIRGIVKALLKLYKEEDYDFYRVCGLHNKKNTLKVFFEECKDILCTTPNLDEDELAELFLNTNWCKYFEDNFQPLSKDGIYKADFEKEKNILTNEMLLNL